MTRRDPRYDDPDGRGVPQDYVEAHMWFNLAAVAGSAPPVGAPSGVNRGVFVKARDAVAERMTADQIAEAQRRAREWKPTPEP